MPIYEYIAEKCRLVPPCAGRRAFLQGINDAPKQACPDCGAPLERVLSSFATGGVGPGTDGDGRNAASESPGGSPPPPTMKNIFGGGLGIAGCGHDGH